MPDEKACRIIVVDDDQTLRQLFTVALSRSGFDVVTASTGTEALQIIANDRVEIALLDIHLPDMTGIDVTRRLVKTTSISVILLTGDDVNYSYETAIHEGAADFIIKPIRIPELLARIQKTREARQVAVERERLVRELERMATQDGLTGLFNYRHLQKQLQSEMGRCVRYQRPLSLIILDADHFKNINDTYGHSEGDQVLAEIAKAAQRGVRSTDIVFRYGGEEFAVLLPETRADAAAAVAERVRKEVSQIHRDRGLQISVSAGVSEYRSPEDAEVFLRRTDAALYESKRNGRNCVTVAP